MHCWVNKGAKGIALIDDENHKKLKEDTAKELMAKFGSERLKFILANTIMQNNSEEHFSQDNSARTDK